MSAFETYREKLVELHRLTIMKCESKHSNRIRDQHANDVRGYMERLWVTMSGADQAVAREISRQLGHDESLCMVVFAHKEGDVIKLHVFDDEKYDDWLTAEAGGDYYVFELIGYDYFIQPGAYPLSQFKDHPRVKEYLKKR